MTPQREEAERMLRLARRDQAALGVLLGAPGVGLSVALFHAQQVAEKALKAVMCLHGVEYRRTHDLEELAAQLTNAGITPSIDKTELRRLTPYAVEFRYDDEATQLLTGVQAQAIVVSLLAWTDTQIGSGPS